MQAAIVHRTHAVANSSPYFSNNCSNDLELVENKSVEESLQSSVLEENCVTIDRPFSAVFPPNIYFKEQLENPTAFSQKTMSLSSYPLDNILSRKEHHALNYATSALGSLLPTLRIESDAWASRANFPFSKTLLPRHGFVNASRITEQHKAASNQKFQSHNNRQLHRVMPYNNDDNSTGQNNVFYKTNERSQCLSQQNARFRVAYSTQLLCSLSPSFKLPRSPTARAAIMLYPYPPLPPQCLPELRHAHHQALFMEYAKVESDPLKVQLAHFIIEHCTRSIPEELFRPDSFPSNISVINDFVQQIIYAVEVFGEQARYNQGRDPIPSDINEIYISNWLQEKQHLLKPLQILHQKRQEQQNLDIILKENSSFQNTGLKNQKNRRKIGISLGEELDALGVPKAIHFENLINAISDCGLVVQLPSHSDHISKHVTKNNISTKSFARNTGFPKRSLFNLLIAGRGDTRRSRLKLPWGEVVRIKYNRTLLGIPEFVIEALGYGSQMEARGTHQLIPKVCAVSLEDSPYGVEILLFYKGMPCNKRITQKTQNQDHCSQILKPLPPVHSCSIPLQQELTSFPQGIAGCSKTVHSESMITTNISDGTYLEKMPQNNLNPLLNYVETASETSSSTQITTDQNIARSADNRRSLFASTSPPIYRVESLNASLQPFPFNLKTPWTNIADNWKQSNGTEKTSVHIAETIPFETHTNIDTDSSIFMHKSKKQLKLQQYSELDHTGHHCEGFGDGDDTRSDCRNTSLHVLSYCAPNLINSCTQAYDMPIFEKKLNTFHSEHDFERERILSSTIKPINDVSDNETAIMLMTSLLLEEPAQIENETASLFSKEKSYSLNSSTPFDDVIQSSTREVHSEYSDHEKDNFFGPTLLTSPQRAIPAASRFVSKASNEFNIMAP